MKLKHTIIALAAPFLMKAQQVMTPEILWTLNKFSVTAVEPSHAGIIYSVGKVDLNTEKTNRQNFYLNFAEYVTFACAALSGAHMHWEMS